MAPATARKSQPETPAQIPLDGVVESRGSHIQPISKPSKFDCSGLKEPSAGAISTPGR
jgi:hypothetical protein